MAAALTWLMDVGSTVIKVCRATPSGRMAPMIHEVRQPGVVPGEQAARLLTRSGFDPSADHLRVCSSASPGPTVGLVGMTGRYSIAAAVRAAVSVGLDVSYTRTLDTPVDGPLPPVDALVAVGGVDGTDHRRLDSALRGIRLAEHPHRVMIWAGARDADGVGALRPDQRVDNVVDGELRARCGPLAESLRRIHLADLVESEGLRALSELVGSPVPATPDVVRQATRELAADHGGSAPVVVMDVGGTTTDVHLTCGRSPSEPGSDPVRSHVLTGLGVARARRALLAELAATADLGDFVDAVAPAEHRSRYLRLREGDGTALPAHDAALACVFLALRQLREEHGINLPHDVRLVVTGGAVRGLAPRRLGRVAEAACGGGPSAIRPEVDASWCLWARGLLALRPAGA